MSALRKQPGYQDKTNPAEIAGELVGDIASKVGSELTRGLFESTLTQVGVTSEKGTPKAGFSGELKVGSQVQTLEIKAQNTEKKINLLEKQFRAVKVAEKTVFDKESKQTEERIKQLVLQISQEVKTLQVQAAQLTGDVNKITVEQVTAKPGAYHVNFFEWVISMLRDLKKEVIQSRTWLTAFKSKKAKKGYWSMFKKHGTSFAMSDERSLATSAG